MSAASFRINDNLSMTCPVCAETFPLTGDDGALINARMTHYQRGTITFSNRPDAVEVTTDDGRLIHRCSTVEPT